MTKKQGQNPDDNKKQGQKRDGNKTSTKMSWQNKLQVIRLRTCPVHEDTNENGAVA